jgi:hypothetical protein
MSFSTMAKGLAQGEIPGVSLELTKSKINDALGKIYDETVWSFQLGQSGGWLIPGLVASVGTVTVTPFSPYVFADAVASAAWQLVFAPGVVPTLQFRNPSYALYDIIAYNTSFDGSLGRLPLGAVPLGWSGGSYLTLDRPWMEPPSGAGQNYYIYQAYFPVPVSDFRSFVEIRDTTDGDYVDFEALSQEDLSVEDPQRVIFGPALPTYAVPFDIDKRPNSLTLGYLRYEVWPHILSVWPLSFTFKRRGALLVNPGDAVPYPLTEELVTFRAKEVLYQYKEAQKGEQMQRGSGADWKFLAESAQKEYRECLKKIRAVDANLHRDFLTRQKRRPQWTQDGFSTNRLGQLNIGSW